MDELRPIRRPRRRRRPRSPNPEARRRLLEAASALIREHGVSGLRVEDLVRRAGFSVATFYLYFEGKDDLFAHVVVEYTQRLRERMQASYHGSGSVPERLARSLETYLDFVEENARGFLSFRDAGYIRTPSGRLSSWALEQHARDLQPLLEQGMADGSLRPEDPERAAQALVGLTQHMAVWWLEHREACSREALARFLLTLTRSGLQG